MCVLPTPLGRRSTIFSARSTKASVESSWIWALGAPAKACVLLKGFDA
jgi:hypothetical protein